MVGYQRGCDRGIWIKIVRVWLWARNLGMDGAAIRVRLDQRRFHLRHATVSTRQSSHGHRQSHHPRGGKMTARPRRSDPTSAPARLVGPLLIATAFVAMLAW